MNLLEAELMAGTDALSDRCTFPGCTSTFRLENHHIVNRSQGGTDGPRRTLCWEHHELCRLRMLHFRWRDGWEYLRTGVSVKYDKALEMEGWKAL